MWSCNASIVAQISSGESLFFTSIQVQEEYILDDGPPTRHPGSSRQALGSDDGTELGSLEGSNEGSLEGVRLGEEDGPEDGKIDGDMEVLGSVEGIMDGDWLGAISTLLAMFIPSLSSPISMNLFTLSTLLSLVASPSERGT